MSDSAIVNPGCTRWTCWEYQAPGGFTLWSWSCSCGLSLGDSDSEPFDVRSSADCVVSSAEAHSGRPSR